MTHLRIENENSNVEIVSNSLILKLYTISSGIEENLEELNLLNVLNQLEEEPLSDYIILKGNLLVTKCKEVAYNYLTGNLPDSNDKRFPNLSINVTVGKYIDFEDPKVEQRVIVWFFSNKQDTNGVSTDELTVPSNLLVGRRGVISGEGNNRMFEGITNVYKFNELSRFTNVTELPPNWAGGSSFIEIDLSNILTFGNACMCYSNISYADLSSVTNIGTEAFEGCSNLTTVVLNPNLTTIGYRTFCDCNKLENIDLSNIVTIGYGAFYKTKLTSVNLSSCTTINGDTNKGAFMLCSNLVSVTLNSNLTTLGRECFNTCTALTSIDLSNITSLGYKAFNDCSSLTSIDLSNVTSIGDSAFSGCTSLSSIGQLNSNLTSIPKGCFKNCTSLTSIDLSNVTSINGDYEAEPFKNCTSLTTVNLSNVRHFGRGCFKGCSNLGLNLDLEVTTTDTAWSGEEFQGTKYRTAVVHGPNLTTWISRSMYSSFCDMPNLTLLDLSDTVITNANSIGNGNNLVTIVYPSTLNYITWDAWGASKSTFKYFIILATTPPSYENVTYCKLTNGNFYVPDDYVAAYKAAWPLIGYQSWNIHDHILPLSSLPVGVWKTGLYQLYEPYLSNSTDPAYS